MNVALRKSMTRDEFFAWAQTQEADYEFDGFQPVAMVGGTLRHSLLVHNIAVQLGVRLRGKPCRPLGSEAAIATVGHAVRYPDAVVTCSKLDELSLIAPEPVVVFEVISPSSGYTDRIVKLREYDAVPSIRHYVLIESDFVGATDFHRTTGDEPFKAVSLDADSVLTLPEIGAEIPMADLFEGVLDRPRDSGA